MTYIDSIFNHSSETMSEIPDGAIQCTVTSPPYYWQRDYGVDGQIGVEPTLAEYRDRLLAVFAEVYRVTAPTGVLWLNISDSYHGDSPLRKNAQDAFSKKWDPTTRRRSAARQGDMKRKDLMGVPHTIAMALRAQGWYWRGDVVWEKSNAMPGGRGAADRPARSHESLFLFSKSASYDFDKSHLPSGTVWKFAPARWDYEDHPAPMPNELAQVCILAGSRRGQTVLDPFMGSGTTAVMARHQARHFVGYELNDEYVRRAHNRLGLFGEASA